MTNILDGLRRRRSRGAAPGDTAARLPLLAYDNLDVHGIGTRLDLLTHAELDAVESYERSHADRGPVLDKLRYMRTHMAVGSDE